jgi:hypothetical protein
MEQTTDITNKYKDLILSRILDENGNFERLRLLLAQCHPEKVLLTQSKYESVDFNMDEKKVVRVNDPRFERLVMVNPPSFEFHMTLNVSGYFNVKYPNIRNPMPARVSPFNIKYSGILVERGDHPEIAGESVKVIV